MTKDKGEIKMTKLKMEEGQRTKNKGHWSKDKSQSDGEKISPEIFFSLIFFALLICLPQILFCTSKVSTQKFFCTTNSFAQKFKTKN